jgi:lysophospholipase L1-like esterase
MRCRTWLRGIILAGVAVMLAGAGLLSHTIGAQDGLPLSWASPTAMAVKQVDEVGGAQNESNFFNNMDCSLVTYRLTAASDPQNGCMTATAFGFFDIDAGLSIFNGTDEALPIVAASAHETLLPWPNALNLLTLDSAPTGGSYVSMYTNPLAHLDDQRNLLGQLTAKQLNAPPELLLRDGQGRILLVNPQSIAFSDGGSWMVVETLYGNFIRLNLASLDVTDFAPAFNAPGSPGLLKSMVAISDSGRYVAIESNAADSFHVYDLHSCDASLSVAAGRCSAYDYFPFLKQQIPGLRSIRHVRFVNESLLSFEAVTDQSATSGRYVMAPSATISFLSDYLGLGDSYASGEGAYDYRLGTDTSDDSCHLSMKSYPLLLTRDLFGSVGGHSVACSGANIYDVGNSSASYRGQVQTGDDLRTLQVEKPDFLEAIEANYLPGYVAQHQFVKRALPQNITVMIGGNDIGFGDMLEKCVMIRLTPHLSDNTCYSTYEDRVEIKELIDRTIPRWTALYKQLISEAPGTHLYAVGYPQLVDDTGTCALNVHLGKSELEFATEVVQLLNEAVAQAAANAHVAYVDVSGALDGHRLCETASYNVAVNGLTAGRDGGILGIKFLGHESYHPNALGHELLEQAILSQTQRLTKYLASGGPSSVNQTFLSKPKTGRTTVKVSVLGKLSSKLASRGSKVTVHVGGAQAGLKAGYTYTVHLDGPSGQIIGSVSTDDTAVLNGEVTLPPDVTSGGHTVDVTGENQAGEASDLPQPIWIVDTPNDTDGDGVTDSLDSCPTITNSGVDADQDGIDDSCDGFIGQPPSSSSGSTSSTGSANSPIPLSITDDGSGPGQGNSVLTRYLTPTVTIVGNLHVPMATQGKKDKRVSIASALGYSPLTPASRQRLVTLRSEHAGPSRIKLRVYAWWPWIRLGVILWFLIFLIVLVAKKILTLKQENAQSPVRSGSRWAAE